MADRGVRNKLANELASLQWKTYKSSWVLCVITNIIVVPISVFLTQFLSWETSPIGVMTSTKSA